MIPKIIHYVWVGDAPKPPEVLDCIESWRRMCQGWEIREWGTDFAKSVETVRRVADEQNAILRLYRHDISKYDEQENLFLRMHECSTMDVIESVLNGYSGIGVLHFFEHAL